MNQNEKHIKYLEDLLLNEINRGDKWRFIAITSWILFAFAEGLNIWL